MATPITVAVAASLKLLATTSVSLVLTNPLNKHNKLIPGTTYSGGVLTVLNRLQRSSNISYSVSGVELHIVRYLADSDDEAAYTLTTLLSDQDILMDESWWRTITGVHEIVESPTLETQEREGNVIRYVILLAHSIIPD